MLPTASIPTSTAGAAAPQPQGVHSILGPRRSPMRVALSRLLSDVVRQPNTYDWEKLHQYVEARLNNLYFRGKQYLSFSPYGTLDMRPSPSDPSFLAFVSKEAQSNNPFLYDYILPIFQGDVLKLSSVVGTRSPNLKSAPVIPGRTLESAISRTADRALAYLHSHLSFDALTQQLSLTLCNSGTAFSYVSWNTDDFLYGSSLRPNPAQPPPRFVPEHEPYFQCPKCGTSSIPADVAQTNGLCPQCENPLDDQFDLIQAENMIEVPGDPLPPILTPNGAVEVALESILTIDLPFNVKSPDLDDCPWIKREYEVLKWSLIRRYKNIDPEIAARAHDTAQYSTLSSQYASDVRQAQYNPSGTRAFSRDPNLWLHTELWITPDMIEAVPHVSDPSGELRDILYSSFRNGAKIAYINSEPVDLVQEDLRRHWAACRPSLSEGVFGDPIFSAYRQGVDVLNDSLNMIVEALEHLPGEVMYDSGLLSANFLRENSPRWGGWIPVKFEGRALSDHIARMPGSDIHEGVIGFMDWYIRQIREAVGITPALFGGDPGRSNRTAREVEIQRNQALQQHLLMWNNMRGFLARTANNAIYLLSTKSQGYLFYRTRVGSPEAGIEMEYLPEITRLAQGGFRIHAEEAFPMGPGQRRDWISDQLAASAGNPAVLAMLGLIEDPQITPLLVPQNMPLLAESLYLPDWHIPLRDLYHRMMEIVAELLQSQPLPPQIDPFTMMPGPMQPSIPPDPVLFPPVYAIRILRDALLQDSLQAEAEANPMGIQNLRAYLEAYLMIEQQQMMAQQQMMMEQQGQSTGTGDSGGAPPDKKAPKGESETSRGASGEPIPIPPSPAPLPMQAPAMPQ